MSFFRIQDKAYAAADLLLEENQTSVSYINEDTRTGVSVCGSREALAEYLAQTGMPFDTDFQLIELEGYYADDEDEDAHLGAWLVHPTKIVSAETMDDEFFEMIAAAHDRIDS